MEIYKRTSKSPLDEKFKELLNAENAKNKIEEGTVVSAEITNIGEKFVWVHLGMKSEAMIEKNQFKNLNLLDKIKVGTTCDVLLENSESKDGSIIVSLEKAHKRKGFEILKKAYEEGKIITGELKSKVKGGLIFVEKETGIHTFMPGSQLFTSSRSAKDISQLMNTEIKAKIIKIDTLRGNLCTSHRAVKADERVADKKEIFSKIKINSTVMGTAKNIASFGVFFEILDSESGTFYDSLCHLQELSYSRVSSPEDLIELGKSYKLKVIGIDMDKMQVSTSIKALSPDPFDNISEFEVGKDYIAICKKNLEYGIFVELREGLSALLHNSELSWSKKNINVKNFAKVNERILVRITEIDKTKRRIAVSHKQTLPNPWEEFGKKIKVGSIISGVVVGKNEYALFVQPKNYSIEAFLHCNDLHFLNKGEDELAKFKKGDFLEKIKVLECDVENQKIRISLREAVGEDPFKFYDKHNTGDILTCVVTSIQNKKGITVIPEGSKIETLIKKSQLAQSVTDQRESRWIKGDRVDVLLVEKKEKNKVTLSIKALEEKLDKEAIKKYGEGAIGSGKSLPFASLSDKINNKKKDSE
tara:strand:+ start:203 stop:1960 length:1758 start_codon:yes stop_codon:yes gene_type:complete